MPSVRSEVGSRAIPPVLCKYHFTLVPVAFKSDIFALLQNVCVAFVIGADGSRTVTFTEVRVVLLQSVAGSVCSA